ncbi:MAG: hypothetical protein Q8918_19435 [Bacteroidota bacterium]|nr:hypothetical protein [Bacteroidota bacterium]
MSKGVINFLIALFLSPIILSAQSKALDCSSVREGTFYFYPLKSKGKFVIIRDGSIQKEINPKTSDTSFWKVDWINDCMLNLKFIRSSQPMSSAHKSFFSSHITVIKVLRVAKDYYVFNGGLDSISRNSAVDTLWLKPR